MVSSVFGCRRSWSWWTCGDCGTADRTMTWGESLIPPGVLFIFRLVCFLTSLTSFFFSSSRSLSFALHPFQAPHTAVAPSTCVNQYSLLTRDSAHMSSTQPLMGSQDCSSPPFLPLAAVTKNPPPELSPQRFDAVGSNHGLSLRDRAKPFVQLWINHD